MTNGNLGNLVHSHTALLPFPFTNPFNPYFPLGNQMTTWRWVVRIARHIHHHHHHHCTNNSLFSSPFASPSLSNS